ncbi:BZ3500_MvSof-1268-A1-R1_Chr2-1g04273 [Microbotryum saponariae]|uniref:BZ3500_MvSof-1268-A1-R1_Chr2-1g04273 protein n=1 Tax=Microbotryum saponariae TaxID=289078 RepID=A0A2X0M285_9BASI|nr:BZ3500_MvSof-1268-A1-R1_Chr2-1g04273 [Microbotryum saponariae]SCZ91287.1 BZ3501_MvSof-1269-A2-R1_Chr2-1g03929 [Microbotryum saponariae]
MTDLATRPGSAGSPALATGVAPSVSAMLADPSRPLLPFERYDSAGDPVSNERTSEDGIEVVPAPEDFLLNKASTSTSVRPRSAGLGQPSFSSLLAPFGVDLRKNRSLEVKLVPAPLHPRSSSQTGFMSESDISSGCMLYLVVTLDLASRASALPDLPAPRPAQPYPETENERARQGPHYVYVPRAPPPPFRRPGAPAPPPRHVSSGPMQDGPYYRNGGLAPSPATSSPYYNGQGKLLTPSSIRPQAMIKQQNSAGARSRPNHAAEPAYSARVASSLPVHNQPVPDVSYRVVAASSRMPAVPAGNRAPVRESGPMRKAPSRDRPLPDVAAPKSGSREPVYLQRRANTNAGVERERAASPRLVYFNEPIPAAAQVGPDGTVLAPVPLPPLIGGPSPEGGQKLKLAGRWADLADGTIAGEHGEYYDGAGAYLEEYYAQEYDEYGQPIPKRQRLGWDPNDPGGYGLDMWDDDGEIMMDSDDEEFGIRQRGGGGTRGGRGRGRAARSRPTPANAADVGERSLAGTYWTPPSLKPFACPNPECDKRFKNANGVKYHTLHGTCHTAAVAPDGSMELDESKPHVCWSPDCDRSYKNANGLRYHYAHSGAHGARGAEMLRLGTHPKPLKTDKRKRPGRPVGSGDEGSPTPSESNVGTPRVSSGLGRHSYSAAVSDEEDSSAANYRRKARASGTSIKLSTTAPAIAALLGLTPGSAGKEPRSKHQSSSFAPPASSNKQPDSQYSSFATPRDRAITGSTDADSNDWYGSEASFADFPAGPTAGSGGGRGASKKKKKAVKNRSAHKFTSWKNNFPNAGTGEGSALGFDAGTDTMGDIDAEGEIDEGYADDYEMQGVVHA